MIGRVHKTARQTARRTCYLSLARFFVADVNIAVAACNCTNRHCEQRTSTSAECGPIVLYYTSYGPVTTGDLVLACTVQSITCID